MVALHAWICSLPGALRSVEKMSRLPSGVGSGLDSLNSVLTAGPRLKGLDQPFLARSDAQRSKPPIPPGRSEEKRRNLPSAVRRGLRSSVGPLMASSGAGFVQGVLRREVRKMWGVWPGLPRAE